MELTPFSFYIELALEELQQYPLDMLDVTGLVWGVCQNITDVGYDILPHHLQHIINQTLT